MLFLRLLGISVSVDFGEYNLWLVEVQNVHPVVTVYSVLVQYSEASEENSLRGTYYGVFLSRSNLIYE